MGLGFGFWGFYGLVGVQDITVGFGVSRASVGLMGLI